MFHLPSNLCRLCAQLKTSNELTAEIDDPILRIKEKLILCCRWSSTTDENNLPQNVCNLCVKKLEQSWEFAESVAFSQTILQKLLFETATAEAVQKTENQSDHDNKYLNELIQPEEGHFVALKVEAGLHDIADNEAGCSDIVLRQPLFDENFHNLTPKAKKQKHLGKKSDFQIKNSPETHNSHKKQKIFNILNSLSTNDCNADGTITDEADAKLNVRRWSDYEYACWKCKKTLKGVDSFRSHIKSNHFNEPKPFRYKCSDCPKIYASLMPFEAHVHIAHNPHLKYCCPICSKFFWDLNLLQVHRRIHSDEYRRRKRTCPLCDKVMSRTTFSRHYLLHLPKQVENNNLFTCDICNKSFGTKSVLRTHMFTHMDESYRSQCLQALRNKNTFICDICDKIYHQKQSLKAHLITHTGQRPHTCEICGMSFAHKGSLKNHLTQHSNDRPFSCEKCEKTFKRKELLQKHKVYHSDVVPYKCETCDRGFRARSSLKAHTRIHSGELPYACDFCEKKFRNSNVYKVHRRIHTGERPYSCKDCNVHSTNWANHNKHMKRIHGINLSKRVLKPENS